MRLFALALLSSTAWATPTHVTHQARLLNASGEPLEGDFTVVFTLWTLRDGGTQEWTETDTVTAQGGYFSTTLGDGTPLDDSVLSQDLWLQTEIMGEGVLGPRVPLNAVPYAILAQSVVGGAVDGEPQPVHGNGMHWPDASGDINVSTHNATSTLPLSTTIARKNVDSTIFVMLNGNVRVRYNEGDRCIFRIYAVGGGYSLEQVALGEVYHGAATDGAGHQSFTLTAVLPPNGQTGNVTFTTSMQAVNAGASDIACYFGHRSDSTLVAMELHP